jgi:hypothetical protein
VASRYDDLDASSELEQQLAADLRLALEGRGCTVVHHGSNDGAHHSPGGKPDIEIRDPENGRLILVEVTKRKASAAEGELVSVTDHLDKAIAAGGYQDYGVLYVSPYTSARLSSSFRDLTNRPRQREGRAGRVVCLDFEAADMLVTRLADAPSEQYPASRLGALLARWEDAGNDSLARLLVQQTIFPEDEVLAIDLDHEVKEFAADQERRLRKQLEKMEDELRHRGVTGESANVVVIYLTFLRLYEERRQRHEGEPNRFTAEGFEKWCNHAPQSVKSQYGNRMVEGLLHEVALDADLKLAGLLRDGNGDLRKLHEKVNDAFVTGHVLPVFDEYDFHTTRVDVLGAVFETLAGRAEKDTKVGQFFTPQPVVDFCADVVPITSRDLVLDPAVGTGRFLIAAMMRMLARAGEDGEARKAAEEAIRTDRLLGSDIGGWVATIAKMNMFIHGDGKTNIRESNGLILGDRGVFSRFPDGLSEQVGVVLTNPPLGDTSHVVAVENWRQYGDGEANDLLDRLGVVPMKVIEQEQLVKAETDLLESDLLIEELESLLPNEGAKKALTGARRTRERRFQKVSALRLAIDKGEVQRVPISSTMKGGALFIGAIADYLQPVRDPDARVESRGGWAAVVVDEAILNTPDYASTRSFIRDRFYVKAVVSLGRGAFEYLAHTNAKTSVIFLVRKPEAGKSQREPVFFAHAERVGYSAKGDWVGDDLPQVKLEYDEVRSAIEQSYRGATMKADDANERIEALPGFGHAFHAAPVGNGGERLDFFHVRSQYRYGEMQERYETVPTLREFIEPIPREHPTPDRKGEYDFATTNRMTGTLAPKGRTAVSYPVQNLWIVRAGDLVVSGIDAVNGAIAVAGADVDGMVLSKEFYAYRVIDPSKASAVYLALALRTPAARELLEGMATGTSNRTRLESADQLLDLPMPPLPPIEEQEAIAATFLQSVESRRSAVELQQEAEQFASGPWEVTGDDDAPLGMDDRVKIEGDPEDALRKILRTPRRA